VHADGQKVVLAVKSMGGESAEAWRSVLDDLIRRGLRRPELLIVDCGSGLESALTAVWSEVPVQRCTVHKHRNLLAHAPERLHEEITADYNDMIYAATAAEVEARGKAFLRNWRVKHRAVADSLEEAGDPPYWCISNENIERAAISSASKWPTADPRLARWQPLLRAEPSSPARHRRCAVPASA
jgi:transposase-like protein